jgi:hypothetical protein
MIRLTRPFFWPRLRTLEELPTAFVQMTLLGAICGPLLGFFFAWLQQDGWHPQPLNWTAFMHWLFYAARAGVTYSLVYYSTINVSVDYLRRTYSPSSAAIWMLYFGAWIVALALLAVLLPSDEHFGRAIREAMWNAQAARVLVIATIISVFIGLFAAAVDRANAEKAAAEARAQVKALQAQINPHFFFNALNTIYGLIAIDPERAQQTLGLLANMSRYAFATAQPDLIPLAHELEFASAYLGIEKVRFGKRLQWKLPDASRVTGIEVPPLSIQPLIENAVRHGISKRMDGGNVFVDLHRDNGWFSLTVENDAEDLPESTDGFFRQDHALHNIRERLRLSYSDRASLVVSFPRPDAVAVTLKAPVLP